MSETEQRISLESKMDTLTTEINTIKSQLTEYRCGNPKGRSEEWYSKANIALNSKRSMLFSIRQKRDEINRSIKANKMDAHRERIELQNKMFYQKLKEIMPQSEFLMFIAEVDDGIEKGSIKGETDGQYEN